MKKVLLIIFTIMVISGPVVANNTDDSDTRRDLPRMAAFRSNLINARSGPGSKYPIEWIYKQKNAPVEIIAEFDLWRKIKDWEGAETWVHKSMLNNSRWVKITKVGLANIYAKPLSDSKVIAKAEDGVIGEIEKCPDQKDFCLIKFASIEGWVHKEDFFGILKDEIIN